MDGWVQGAVETVGRKGMYQPPSSKRRRMQKVLFFLLLFFFFFLSLTLSRTVSVYSVPLPFIICYRLIASTASSSLSVKRKEKEDVFYFQGV